MIHFIAYGNAYFFCIYSSTVNSRFTDFLAQKLCIDLVVVLHFLFSENWFDDIWISFWICFNDGISIIMKYPSFQNMNQSFFCKFAKLFISVDLNFHVACLLSRATMP